MWPKNLQSGCTIFCFHWWCMKNPVTLHPYLILMVFLILAFLVGEQCYFIVVLFCISLMTKDFEHLFIWLLAIWISFWSVPIQLTFSFKSHLFSWVWGSPLYIMEFISLFLDIHTAVLLSGSVTWHLPLHGFFWWKKFSILMKISVSVSLSLRLVFVYVCAVLRNLYLLQGDEDVLLFVSFPFFFSL